MKYQFTNAAGNRIVEKCLTLNNERHMGFIPYEFVHQCLRDEQYYGEYSFGEFIEWLKGNDSSPSSQWCLALVACGMARQLREDREFIDKVEAFHTAMNRRFKVEESDIVKGGE
jgi:hypothetical protein